MIAVTDRCEADGDVEQQLHNCERGHETVFVEWSI